MSICSWLAAHGSPASYSIKTNNKRKNNCLRDLCELAFFYSPY